MRCQSHSSRERRQTSSGNFPEHRSRLYAVARLPTLQPPIAAIHPDGVSIELKGRAFVPCRRESSSLPARRLRQRTPPRRTQTWSLDGSSQAFERPIKAENRSSGGLERFIDCSRNEPQNQPRRQILDALAKWGKPKWWLGLPRFRAPAANRPIRQGPLFDLRPAHSLGRSLNPRHTLPRFWPQEINRTPLRDNSVMFDIQTAARMLTIP
jgi:hypothetical protein